MMSFRCDWVENKKDDWKIATLVEIVEGGRTFNDVSINKIDKKGRAFPNFDAIAPGATVHGNIWQNPANSKFTLFAPDEPRTSATAPRPATAGAPAAPYRSNSGMAAAQTRKAEGIREAQDNKEKGIKASSAMRDSTAITTELVKQGPPEWTLEDFQVLFKRVRDWYLKMWKETEDMLDLPF